MALQTELLRYYNQETASWEDNFINLLFSLIDIAQCILWNTRIALHKERGDFTILKLSITLPLYVKLCLVQGTEYKLLATGDSTWAKQYCDLSLDCTPIYAGLV